MQIALFILFCLYVAWTALIAICVGTYVISKYVMGQKLAPLNWNWLPKVVWIISTLTVVIYFWKM